MKPGTAAVTWERAIQAAREQDEEVDPRRTTAPAETLAGLLHDDHLG